MGFDVEGVPCISIALDPCSFCCGEVSLCATSVFFFGALPFICCTIFWVGFPGFVDFLGTVVSASVLGGTSWVRTGTLQSSCQSRMAISISSSLTQYLGCSHSLCGSLCTWIHMVCLVALGYLIVLRDHIRGNSPSVGYAFLYFCKILGKGTHVCASVLGV
jgi:hypothetical protein